MQLPDGKHRKLRRSYNEPVHAHHLTFSCYGRLPLLSRDRTRRWMLDALAKCRERNGVELFAYVIMPEHAHVLLRPAPGVAVSQTLKAVKQSVARRAASWLREHDTGWANRLRVTRRDGSEFLRFWQPGGGWDRNIVEPRTLLQVGEYIHANPVRRGLVAAALEWEWSSARFYEGDTNARLGMDALPV